MHSPIANEGAATATPKLQVVCRWPTERSYLDLSMPQGLNNSDPPVVRERRMPEPTIAADPEPEVPSNHQKGPPTHNLEVSSSREPVISSTSRHIGDLGRDHDTGPITGQINADTQRRSLPTPADVQEAGSGDGVYLSSRCISQITTCGGGANP